MEANTLVGPLHTKHAVKQYVDGLKTIEKQGGKILCGGKGSFLLAFRLF